MGILDGIVSWLAQQVMNILDMISNSVLEFGLDDIGPSCIKRYFTSINSYNSYILGTYSYYPPIDNIVYSNYDVYTYNGALVFQRPLPSPTPTPSLQQKLLIAVEKTNPGAVMMNQVVGLVPLLIGFAITLIGFSKALQTLFQVLRMA